MRIWSLHPEYLDAEDLVALWRQGLLAQTVLQDETGEYSNHPQLLRFRESENPVAAIATYLRAIAEEGDRRGYQFDSSKIVRKRFNRRIRVTTGQVGYEFEHLMNKFIQTAPKLYARYSAADGIRLHPLFVSVEGDVEDWEVIWPNSAQA